jgi:hypothetical protein
MGVNSQLGAPSAANMVEGKYSLNRIVRCEATVAATITPVELGEVQSFVIDGPSWDTTKKVFQQGGGDIPVNVRRGYNSSGTITISKGHAMSKLAAFFGKTLGSTNTNAIPGYIDKDFPSIVWEAIARDRDNNTHLYSVVVPDMIIDDLGIDHPMENSDFSIKWHSYYPWFLLYARNEVVYSKFTGDGSTMVFTLPAAAITLITESEFDLCAWDKAFYIKEKATGTSTGLYKTSGYTISGSTLTAAVAPAIGTEVQILFAKATA